MKAICSFLVCFALLWGAVLLILGLKSYALDNPILLFIAMLGLGSALALIGKRWGRGALLLVAPLAVLLAYIGAQRLLPTAPFAHEFARVYRLNSEKAKLQQKNDFSRYVMHTQSMKGVCPNGTEYAPFFKLLSGVEIQIIACGLKGLSSLVFGADKILYASATDSGLIYRLEPPDRTAVEDSSRVLEDSCFWRKTIISASLDSPMGLAWHTDYLYVATRTSVAMLLPGTSIADTTIVRTVAENLPAATPSERRAVLVDGSGCTYLSVAAVNSEPLNLEWQRGAILKIPAHGEISLFATGIHHARAMAWHPETGALWLGENSPRTLDFSPPADEINIVYDGQDYGWPFCYGFQTPDRQLGTTAICAGTAAPLLTLPPHSVPAGLAFGTKLNAPAHYRSMVYIALAGQQDDLHRHGFRILGLPLDAHGDLTGWGVDVALGWVALQHMDEEYPEGKYIYGQPAALAVGPDGNLYLADSYAGVVYRLVFSVNSTKGQLAPEGRE